MYFLVIFLVSQCDSHIHTPLLANSESKRKNMFLNMENSKILQKCCFLVITTKFPFYINYHFCDQKSKNRFIRGKGLFWNMDLLRTRTYDNWKLSKFDYDYIFNEKMRHQMFGFCKKLKNATKAEKTSGK